MPDPAQSLIDHAKLAMLAVEANIRAVNAGSAAIALTPTKADKAAMTAAGLIASEERWLAKEGAPYEQPLEAAIELLATLTED